PERPSRQPPAAQGLFCAAYWLTPLNPAGWRIVLLGFDGLAAGAVLGLLGSTRRPLSYFALYFWNPLLLFETYLHGHPDLAAAALVVTAAFFLVRRHRIFAAAALALAAGVSLWPLLLAPFLVLGAPGNRRAKVLALLVCAAVATLWLVSYRVNWLDPAAGGWFAGSETTAFATGAFWAIQRACRHVLAAGMLPISGDLLGWGVVVGILLLGSLLLAGLRPASARSLCLRLGWWIMLMLLLSPAASCWHYLAVIPLAAIVPRWGFLCWTLLLPLGYLPPEILADRQGWSWLLHVPVWLLLVGELVRSYRNSTDRQTAVSLGDPGALG
ncbi:MAG: hypothetical protein JW810_10490, partial [Sedimentisphaerales bacterium]|nr:hypothetical protein [Sedimentisphaerales bacterium]